MFHTQIRPEIDGLSKLQRFSEAMLSDYELAWKKEMMRRALAAYFRQGGTCLPCKYLSYVTKHGGKYYAYLADDSGALAVYRISGKNSFKRKARIWPKAIESAPMIRQGMAIYAAQRRASPDFYNQEDDQY